MPETQRVYVINNWYEKYENHRHSTKVKNIRHIKSPQIINTNDHILINSKTNGAAIFGVWYFLVMLTVKCRSAIWGALLRKNGYSHTVESIAIATGFDEDLVREAITVFICEWHWMKIVEISIQDKKMVTVESSDSILLDEKFKSNLLVTNLKDKIELKEKERIINKRNIKEKQKFFKNPEVEEAFKYFRKMRIKIKKPLNERSEQMLFTKLEGITKDQSMWKKILDQSTFHCWQGVFSLRDDDIKQNHQSVVEQFEEQKKRSDDALKEFKGQELNQNSLNQFKTTRDTL